MAIEDDTTGDVVHRRRYVVNAAKDFHGSNEFRGGEKIFGRNR